MTLSPAGPEPLDVEEKTSEFEGAVAADLEPLLVEEVANYLEP